MEGQRETVDYLARLVRVSFAETSDVHGEQRAGWFKNFRRQQQEHRGDTQSYRTVCVVRAKPLARDAGDWLPFGPGTRGNENVTQPGNAVLASSKT